MSAITEWNADTDPHQPAGIHAYHVPEWLVDGLALIFYSWADAHRHDVVIKKKILLFTVTITVGDCERLVEFLIGPRPAALPVTP